MPQGTDDEKPDFQRPSRILLNAAEGKALHGTSKCKCLQKTENFMTSCCMVNAEFAKR